jgi:RNA polymerase sigma factor for flagellar operon FliA
MKLPIYIDRDNLRSAGLEGLVQAAHSFSEDHGVPFRHFAALRIRGAIMDDLRRNDWATRSVRQAGRARKEAVDHLVATLGSAPKNVEIAEYMGVSVEELRTLDASLIRGSVLSLDANLDSGSGQATHYVDADSLGPEEHILDTEFQTYLRAAVSALPDRLGTVITRYFLQGHAMADIAEDLGVTESRVSQLRAEALVLLRDGMNSHLAPEQVPVSTRPGGAVDRRRSAYFASVAEHRLLGLDQRLTEDKRVSRDRERQPITPGVAS